MTTELIKKDSRLFLFQVLEYGFEQKRLDQAFLNQLKKQGAQMSFVFAKRYYNVIQEACLRQASHCVLGIINIGLIESSGHGLDNAIDQLLQKGYVSMFKQGWTRLLDLVQYAGNAQKYLQRTNFEWEKNFAESLSAEPGREWVGHDEYLIHMLLYCNQKRRNNGAN
ncbi:MAG: hypothetical protein GY729_07495 [Desulfobacteraceae bacterium]|nr:hypothetical protein [Desulfobacteraceae bacterium]